MVGPKSFSVELKESLLEYLLEQAEDWDGDSPDIRIFWHTIERDFEGAKGTTWHGKDFEQKMEREEEAWLEECEDPDKKRRRGHEKDSNYDKLMAKWCAIWNKMLQKHWQYMVDTGEEQFELVPKEFQPLIKVPKPHYEYDGAKLQRVVQAAMERARESGKYDLSAAVEQVYFDALNDTKLRMLLEAILTQKADRQQNEEFQAYVKLAKAKIREQNVQKQKQDDFKAAAANAAKAHPVSATAIPNPVVHMPIPNPYTNPPPATTTVVHHAPLPAQAPVQIPTPAIAKGLSIVEAAPPPPPPPAPAPAASVAAGASTPVVTPQQPASAKKATKTPQKTTPKAKPASKIKLPGQPKIVPNAKAKPQAEAPLQPGVGSNTSVQISSSTITQPISSATTQPSLSTIIQPESTQDFGPRVTAILGDLQFATTAQQILRAAPDIGDSRLHALKSTLINHPETKTDFNALAARLEKESSVAADSQAVAGASRPARVNAGKRRRTSASASSMAEAEQDDLLEAQRAAKRRRGELGEDDGGDYHPLKAVREKSRKKKKSGVRPSNSQSGDASNSRDTSPLSDLSEMDIESTKSAYVDELVRRRTVEQARNDIVEQYGPVSPTDAGDNDEDWASMASPTLGPTQLDGDGGQFQLTERVPSPPPEPAPAENDALRLISGAAAQAVARDPGIGRLEAKLDSLITASSGSNGQTANDLNRTNTETLKQIANVLTTADLAATRPEFVKLVLQLTTNAAEAAIHSAEAAKKAGEMARDVGLILGQLGIQGAGGQPATPLSEN